MNSPGRFPPSTRLGGLLSLFLFVVIPLWPQTPFGATVSGTEYDRAKGVTTVYVVNSSHKDISAFSILETTFYVDGTTNSVQKTTDYLPMIISLKLSGFSTQQGNGALPPGAMKTIVTPQTKQVDKVVAVVQLVVYTDGTAEVSNRQEFNALMARRKGEALGLQRANDLITSALNSNDQHPAATVANKLAALQAGTANNLPRDNPEAYVSDGYNIVAAQIARAPKSDQADYLRAMIERHTTRASLMIAHSQLKEVQP